MKKNDLTPTVVEVIGNHVKLTTHDAFASGQMVNLVYEKARSGHLPHPHFPARTTL